MAARSIHSLGLICSFACSTVLLVACGDDTGTSGGSATMTTTTASGTTTGADTSTTAPDPTSGGTQGGATDGTGTASATGTTTTGPTTGPGETDGTTTTGPGTSGSTTDPVMTSGSSSGGDTTMLPPGVCGDGVLNPGEACDDGPNNGPDKDCYEDCTANVCGDAVIGSMEECDLGAMNGPDDGCSLECKILPSSCGNQTAEAQVVKLPVDIIFVIDNSGSMGNEIKGVQDNINKNFAQIIEASGLDYRVIMVSRHGNFASAQSVCIEAPLSGIPLGGCTNPPSQPVNAAKFFHYSVEISSSNAWCQILATLNLKDEFNLAPMGWRTWLRGDSFKNFVVISDDRVSCSFQGKSYNDGNTVQGGMTAATAFDASLLAAAPSHFGMSPQARNYNWYSIVGVPYNMPPEAPYSAKDPVFAGTQRCPTAVNSGPGHQTLSNMTDALRFPLCDPTKYDVMFQAIAQGVVSSAKVACNFNIPPPPMGKILDPESIEVDYTPMGQMNAQTLKQVAGPAECTPDSFYVQGDQVILCPEACMIVQADKGAKLEVNFTCEPLKPN